MRLTTHQSIMGRNRKHDIAYGMGSIWLKKIGKYKYELIEDVIDKLGQLEDIEEELGIDLITLFKLLDAVYVYSYGHTDIVRCLNDLVSLYDKSITIYNGTCIMSYPLSEYGKSFALTKEELEHGQSSNQE